MSWTGVASAQDVAAAISAGEADLAIVDCRFALGDPGAGERAWRQARLPNAVYAHLDRDLSAHASPSQEPAHPRADLSAGAGAGRHPLPSAEAFAGRLGDWGITPAHRVLAYDDAGGALAAARLWWLLKLLDHERVAVLDGGIARWRALGLPLDEGPPAQSRAAAYAPRAFDARRIVEAEAVERRLHDAPGWLLDARAAERFRGEVEPIDRVAGRVPGARNRPYAENLAADGRFKPADALAHEFRALIGDRDPGEIVLMCGSGVTACQNLLAMEYAGLHGARVYAGSWSGWIEGASRPIARG